MGQLVTTCHFRMIGGNGEEGPAVDLDLDLDLDFRLRLRLRLRFERRTVAADAGDATDGRDHHCARRLAHRVYRDWGVSECITLDHQVRARVR